MAGRGSKGRNLGVEPNGKGNGKEGNSGKVDGKEKGKEAKEVEE